MRFGLKEDIIEKINKVFSHFPEVEEVILYGSRAKGNFKEGSDVDFALNGNKLHLFILNKISYQLDDLNLPYTFDLQIYGQIYNPGLLEHIKRVGINFYKRERNE